MLTLMSKPVDRWQVMLGKYLGIICAAEARMIEPLLAYPAGLSFMGAAALLLHYCQVPLYKYGLYFVPGSLLLIWRAWSFEKSNREALAAPYFHLAQLAVCASVLATISPALATDATFAKGKIGLWTKSDSVTAFNDLEALAR